VRLLAAIDIPGALRNDLSSLQDAGALSARWTGPEQCHIALQFVGEVPNEQAVAA